MKIIGMYGIERCPQCHIPPELKREKKKLVFMCNEHRGFMAMGDNLEKAKENWNIFAMFMQKAA